MKTAITATVLFSITLILIGSVSLFDIRDLSGIAAQVISSQQQGIYRSCIKTFSENTLSTFKISEMRINNDSIDDAVVSYTKGPQCGTTGCVNELCVSNDQGEYIHVPFGFAARSIVAKETINSDMHDLMLNNDSQTRMTWNGTRYILSSN